MHSPEGTAYSSRGGALLLVGGGEGKKKESKRLVNAWAPKRGFKSL